jgi:hypothetical protein
MQNTEIDKKQDSVPSVFKDSDHLLEGNESFEYNSQLNMSDVANEMFKDNNFDLEIETFINADINKN